MSRGGREGGVAVYVTSHGFGHLNRSAAVINRIPRGIPVSVRSDPGLFNHWPQRVTRPIELGSFVSDSGAVNPPGDSNTTDGRATLERRSGSAPRRWTPGRRGGLAAPQQRIAVIACDAPAVPLVAARRAGIPGFLMSNFTWADIYAPYARELGGEALRLVADLRSDYRHATALFRMQPSMKMAWLKPVDRRRHGREPGTQPAAELVRALGLSRRDRVVYLYVGRYGQDDLDWSRLERFGDRGIHFAATIPRREADRVICTWSRRPTGRAAT